MLHSLPELATAVAGSVSGVGEGEWFGGAALNSIIIICKVVLLLLKYCKHHAQLWYIPKRRILHSLPELLVGSAGEVGEVEWFGGAAMNNILCEDSMCLNTVSIMLNCDTRHTNEQHNQTT